MDNSNYFTLIQISLILGVATSTVKGWLEKQGLKTRRVKIHDNTSPYVCVHVSSLLAWLKDNQDKWNSCKLGLGALGSEPEWLKEKRQADSAITLPPRRMKQWTPEEDAILIRMYKAGCKHKEIAGELNRSLYGVQQRACRLDIWGTGKYLGKKRSRFVSPNSLVCP